MIFGKRTIIKNILYFIFLLTYYVVFQKNKVSTWTTTFKILFVIHVLGRVDFKNQIYPNISDSAQFFLNF